MLYWLVIFSPFSFHSSAHEGPKESKESEGVSIIVCAHNQLHNLKNLLPALMSQDHPRFEVLIVDDRSVDGTDNWLRSQQTTWANLIPIQITEVPQGLNPKKHALTKGIQAAQYELLLLTDADCTPVTNRWVSSMSLQYDQATDIVLGYSGYFESNSLLNKLIRYETVLTAMQYLSRAIVKQPYMGVGRNLSYRKSFFQKVGGLDQVMHITGGDDDLLINRFATGENTAYCLSKESVIKSIPKARWKTYFRQKLRHLSVGKHYKSRDKWILGIFSATHIIFWSSLVSLLMTQTLVFWVAVGYLVRQLALSLIVGRSSRKLGEHINAIYVPLLDFMYSFFYLYTGLAALTTKKINWH